MFTKEETLKEIKKSGIVAVIRMADIEKLIETVKAIRKGGVRCIEIAMTTPDAINMIKEITDDESSDIITGAGTVLDSETARAAILAGAEYIVSPVLNIELIKLCKRYNKTVIPGAFTPTEILIAWEQGADIVKVFPARAVGPKYFGDIKAPLPQVELMPTGGISIENAADYIKAGACAVAIGSALLDKKAIAEQNYYILTEKAEKLVESIKQVKR
ncbi:2-dehydro-3-deoxyphosphogluconate aldolase [candidate division KSB1 bacterium]|nr:MAG: 2-dehydro-3-deoxyphosphogluconate aldolase [candidate division KSB1 bacterium]